MTWLLDILRPFARITVAKVAQVTWNTLEIGAGLRWRNDPTNERGILDVDPNGQALTSPSFSDPTITGTLTQGTYDAKTGTGTTTGPATATVLTLPLANSTGGTLDLRIAGRAPNVGTIAMAVTIGVAVESNVLGVGSGSPVTLINAAGLPVDADVSWSAGTLSVLVMGPTATITGAGTADAGASTLITTGAGLTSDLNGRSVTISGVVGGTGINGAHIATFVDSTHFKIPVAWVGYTSGGTVVLTTAPVIPWQARGEILATS